MTGNEDNITKINTISSYKVLIVKNLLSSEIQEKRMKGLCFSCDEKYAPRHRWKQLFLSDTYSAKEMEEMKCEYDPIVLLQEAKLEISLRAVNESWAPDTMRMLAQIYAKSLILLLDTGSTHNFLSKEVVKL